MISNVAIAPEQITEFERVFQLFDANGDGFLTRQEITEALEVLGRGISLIDRTKLINTIDADGIVKKDAFTNWMANRADMDITADLKQIFNLIDVDRSGKLSLTEFIQIIRCFNTTTNDAELETLVRQADLDGDGEIDFEEFLHSQSQISDLKISMTALRGFKKTLMQYIKVAEISSLALIEVDSELGAGTRGASTGTTALKNAAIEKQVARMHAENGILSQDSLRIQTENTALSRIQLHKHAKYIDAIYHVLSRTADLVADSLTKGLFPIVLGGDHSTAAGTIAGIKKAFPDRHLGVVWIDAHADIHSPFTSPSGNLHGMPLAIATNSDNLDKQINDLEPETAEIWRMCQQLGLSNGANLSVDDIVYVAVRDTEEAEDHLIETHHILNITTEKLQEIGAEAVAQRCLEKLTNVDLIYVSFDVDSMDSTIAMGTGTPVPGGILAEEARLLNATLVKDPRVCCWEICEINPLIDTLNTIVENSLGIFESVVDAVADRLEKSA